MTLYSRLSALLIHALMDVWVFSLFMALCSYAFQTRQRATHSTLGTITKLLEVDLFCPIFYYRYQPAASNQFQKFNFKRIVSFAAFIMDKYLAQLCQRTRANVSTLSGTFAHVAPSQPLQSSI